jgi:hypothetical protein
MPLLDFNFAQGIISGGAFLGCENMEYVILPDTMDIIADDAFAGCVNLKSFVSYKSGYRLASNQLPCGIIGVSAFMRCDSLLRVVLPDTITVIEDYAFACCKSLTTLDFPKSLLFIGWRAFWRCENLKALELPDSMISVEKEAFLKCPSLKTIRCSNPSVLYDAKLRKGIQII